MQFFQSIGRLSVPDRGDLYLRSTLLAGIASVTAAVRRVRAITAAAYAHKCCVVTELKAFVGLIGAAGCIVIWGTNFSSAETFLQFCGAIHHRAALVVRGRGLVIVYLAVRLVRRALIRGHLLVVPRESNLAGRVCSSFGGASDDRGSALGS